MQEISVRIPDPDLEELESLQDFPNRSEAIRAAVRQFLEEGDS